MCWLVQSTVFPPCWQCFSVCVLLYVWYVIEAIAPCWTCLSHADDQKHPGAKHEGWPNNLFFFPLLFLFFSWNIRIYTIIGYVMENVQENDYCGNCGLCHVLWWKQNTCGTNLNCAYLQSAFWTGLVLYICSPLLRWRTRSSWFGYNCADFLLALRHSPFIYLYVE